tara:strand:+ start:433 stop:741 length:309 start_codon:yes stop_codon:yes gene_type:complete
MSRKAYIIDAVIAGWPGVEIGIEENDYNRIKWIKGGPIPEDEINAKVIELQAQYDAEAYKAKRKKEYPTIEELVVALYDSEDRAAIDAKRAEIKLKYPKPVA